MCGIDTEALSFPRTLSGCALAQRGTGTADSAMAADASDCQVLVAAALIHQWC